MGYRQHGFVRRVAPIALVPALLAGCSGTNYNPATAVAVAPVEALPEPTLADMYGTQRDVRVGPGDKLAINVFGMGEGDRAFTVDGSGNIAFPLAGSVPAAGRTTAEIAGDIQARLGARYLQNPQVTVNVTEAVSQRVYVSGGVGRPGAYALTGSATLTDAIALAAGVTEFGRASEVVVFRTVAGRKMAARFDLKAINGGRSPDPAIYPADRIVVANDSNRALLRDLAPLVPVAGLFFYVL